MVRTRTSAVPAVAVAVGALAALLPGAAAASAAPANSPVDAGQYRIAADAEPVEGSASSANGGRLAAGKTYTDAIGPEEQLYYSVTLDAKSTAWVSAVAVPRPGTKVDGNDGIELALAAKDGTPCGMTSRVEFDEDNAARPIANHVRRLIQPDGECQQAGVYDFTVTREGEATGGPEDWVLELRFMEEPPLAKAASTTPPEPESLPTEQPPPPTAKAEPRTGGTGFNDAVGIDQGVWSDRIKPGDTHFYRVPLDWGQQLFLTAEFGTTRVTDPSDYASRGVGLDFYDPARGHVGSYAQSYYGDEPAAAPLGAPPIAYENRYQRYLPGIGNTGVAGWYYLAVTVTDEVGEFTAGGGVPVVLRTTVTGEPKEGPVYDGDAAAAGFGVTDEDRDTAAAGRPADEDGDGDGAGRTILAIAGIGAGVVLLAGLGLWTLLARRRAAPGAGPGPGSGAGPGAGPRVAGEDTRTAPGVYPDGPPQPGGPYGAPQGGQPYGEGYPPPGPQQNWRR
ncbi:hypothetical protein [Streptomyces sp. MAR4 CNX-425]|uniref:hypothetical protein n=1 Tax=Streptomyces sp. MAR4 CNX-425 TaxID=3406343 RepID=UPI003B502F4B